jgi:hypothetical protein
MNNEPECRSCGSREPLAFTGRRWLCHQCWAENMGEAWPATRIGAHTMDNEHGYGLVEVGLFLLLLAIALVLIVHYA